MEAWLEDGGRANHDQVGDERALETLTGSKRNESMLRHCSSDPGADGWSGIAAPLLSAASAPVQERLRKYVHHAYKTGMRRNEIRVDTALLML